MEKRPAETQAQEHRPPPRSSNHVTKNNLEAVRRLSARLAQERSRIDVVIDALTAFTGSKAFIWIHLAWYGLWVLLNTLGPPALRFDPFPFNFLTLIVSLEAIFLSTFILITQNRESRLASLRENLDLQINMLSEQENTKMLSMLEAIQHKLGIRNDGDPELPELEQQVQPEALAREIEQTLQHPASGQKK